MNQARTYLISDPAAVTAKVKAAGGPAIDLSQAIGEASADGVTIGWNMSKGQIVITIIHKPWVATYGAIWSHVETVLGNPIA